MKNKPSKLLGQHFLRNEMILDKIVEASEIQNDVVLEIGAGEGNLTKNIAKKAEKVIAIEKDKRLIPELKKSLSDFKNISLISGDVLKISPYGLGIGDKNYKIIGNIPYYLTSRLLRIIFEKWPKPKLVVLTIQKEVAQRIVAKPPKMSLLSVSVQFYSKPEIITYISKKNFYPPPEVDSAIVKLIPSDDYESQIGRDEFFKVTKAGFSQKRKFLLNNLSTKLKVDKGKLQKTFKEAGLMDKVRAENLSLENWVKLTRYLRRDRVL